MCSISLKSQITLYSLMEILTRLDYTINKSVFSPTSELVFLGLKVNTEYQQFSIPSQKRERFKQLREYILDNKHVGLKTLQRFHGKCVSFMICIPGARLHTRQLSAAISRASNNSRMVV